MFIFFFSTEVDFDQPLPPPKAAANTLKASSLRAIQQWNEVWRGLQEAVTGVQFSPEM